MQKISGLKCDYQTTDKLNNMEILILLLILSGAINAEYIDNKMKLINQYMAEGNLKKAENLLTEYFDLSVNKVEDRKQVYHRLSDLYLMRHKYHAAVNSLKKASVFSLDKPYYYQKIANIYQKIGDFSQAFQYYFFISHKFKNSEYEKNAQLQIDFLKELENK